MAMKVHAIKTDNSCSLLTPMLKCMQPKGGMNRSVYVPIEAKHATFLVQLIVVKGVCTYWGARLDHLL